jgi:putative membrane protein insertion efficiency factor
VLARALILLIRVYQWTLSPLLGNCCRFEPSCSRYMAESLDRHGTLRGGYLGLKRILRCNPWNAGGYDPVPHALGPGSPVHAECPACGTGERVTRLDTAEGKAQG